MLNCARDWRIAIGETSIGSSRGLGIVDRGEMFILNNSELRVVEINGAVDRASGVFHDQKAGRPDVIRIEARELGVSYRAPEHGVQLGLGIRELRCW